MKKVKQKVLQITTKHNKFVKLEFITSNLKAFKIYYHLAFNLAKKQNSPFYFKSHAQIELVVKSQ